MILDDCCQCGHERRVHDAELAINDQGTHTVDGACEECVGIALKCYPALTRHTVAIALTSPAIREGRVCVGFVRDRLRHWLVAARFADVVAQGNGRMRVERISPPGDGRPGGWRLEALVASDVDIAAPNDADEAYQLCDMVIARWMSRMEVARLEAQGNKIVDVMPPSDPCPTCGVHADSRCIPVHAGERDAGGWSHPARVIKVAAKADDSEVVRWARRVKSGEQRNAWPDSLTQTIGTSRQAGSAIDGLETDAELRQRLGSVTRLAVMQVVDEILRLDASVTELRDVMLANTRSEPNAVVQCSHIAGCGLACSRTGALRLGWSRYMNEWFCRRHAIENRDRIFHDDDGGVP